MSLLMEALRKAEQGKSPESGTDEQITASVSADQDQMPDEDLLRLDLPEETQQNTASDRSESFEDMQIADAPRVSSPQVADLQHSVDDMAKVIPVSDNARPTSEPDASRSNDVAPVRKPLSPVSSEQTDASESRPSVDASDSRDSAGVAGTADMAEILFEAKRGSRKKKRLLILMPVLVLFCTVGLGAWYYFILEQNDGLFEAGGPVVAATLPRETKPLVAPVVQQLASTQDAGVLDAESVSQEMVEKKMPPADAKAQNASSGTLETEATAPVIQPEQQTSVETGVESTAQNTAGTSQRPESNPVPRSVKNKPEASAQAVYERALNRQAQPTGSTHIEIRRSRKQVRDARPLNEAWKAFHEHRYQEAGMRYQTILEREPLNRDALLGLAAVAIREGQLERAHATYLKLLERDPRDPLALAGLISLRGQRQANQSLARLQQLISANPDVPELHFVLGNLYAGQSRWSYAQQAYFKAYAGEPGNAEYLFNLAVSLDHLGKKTQSLQFYRKAVEQATEQPVKFSVDAVRTRIRILNAEG